MSDNRSVVRDLMSEAAQTILRDRPGVHGSAENSFEMIGDLWTVFTRHCRRVRGNDTITPADVAQMMVMLKQCRAVYGDANNRDNFVDGLGYTALAGMLQLPDPNEDPVDAAEKKIEATLNEKGLPPMAFRVDAKTLYPTDGSDADAQ